MGGWICAMVATIAMLNVAALPAWAVVAVVSAPPALFAAAVFGIGMEGGGGGGGGTGLGGAAGAEGGGGERLVSARTALSFAAMVAVDKNGEAIMDAATALYVRDALASGQCCVLARSRAEAV